MAITAVAGPLARWTAIRAARNLDAPIAQFASLGLTQGQRVTTGRALWARPPHSSRRPASSTATEAAGPSSATQSLDTASQLSSTSTAPSSSTQLPPLRPYQEECVAECLESLAGGATRIGVSSPTGSGKTTMFTALLNSLPPIHHRGPDSPPATRVLIVVNTIELALQTARVVSRAHPDKLVEIEQGVKYKASGVADVTVATYQTLHRSEDRLAKFDPSTFKAVIVDEAHHAASKSYRELLGYFHPEIGKRATEEGRRSTAPVVPVIGFSATFSRHDGLALGSVFERIVFHRDFLAMIEDKWLSPIRFTSVRADVDLSKVKTGANGDFSSSSLAAVVNTPVVNRLIVRTWLDRAHGAGRRSTLIFCVDVAHVQHLTQDFREAGIDARWMHGKTPSKERQALLEAFRNGEFPVLLNCAILTEGADVPSIDCVLLARPTRSRNLFSQMIGRGMRLSPQTGKKDCLILDLVGNVERGVVCTPTLFGLDPDTEIEGLEIDELRELAENAPEPTLSAEDLNAHPLLADPRNVSYIDWESPQELQRAMASKGSGVAEKLSPLAWVDCGNDVYVLDVPPNRGHVRIEKGGQHTRGEEGDDEHALGGTAVDASRPWVVTFTARNIDAEEAAAANPFARRRVKASPYRRSRLILQAESLEAALRSTDTFALTKLGSSRALLSRHASWRQAPASERQRSFVAKRLGMTKKGASGELESLAITKGDAATILTRIQHGAKGRWERGVKARNRVVQAQEREKQRLQREEVRVGELPRA